MLYPKKYCQKNLQQPKDLNTLRQAKNRKNQTSVAETQYQKLDNAFESNKNQEGKTNNKRSRTKSDLAYNNCFIFYKHHNIKEFAKHSFDSK